MDSYPDSLAVLSKHTEDEAIKLNPITDTQIATNKIKAFSLNLTFASFRVSVSNSVHLSSNYHFKQKKLRQLADNILVNGIELLQ